MPGPFLVRPGDFADLAAIASIQADSREAACWAPADYLAYDLRVAICENRVAGFLAARALADDECEILNLAVAPEYRRRGLARALVQSLLEGWHGAIFLEVRASNSGARALYKSLGFQELTLRGDYYDSPPEPAIVMKFHS